MKNGADIKRNADFIFIGVLGLFLANLLIQFVMTGNLLTLNNYLGILLWLIIGVLRFINYRYGRHGLALLLLLGTFDIASFGPGGVSFSVGLGSLGPIGFDPLVLIVLIIYYFVNKTAIKQVVKTLLYPSSEEQQLEYQKQTDFYLRKFENCGDDELEVIVSNLKEYPLAAQHAITEICKAKGTTIK